MKIFDCFMYFDEDIVLDVRLNYLFSHVDKFVIVEAKYNHNGEKRKPKFNINNFSKFKDKIIYLLVDEDAPLIEKIYDTDNDNEEIWQTNNELTQKRKLSKKLYSQRFG